MSNDQFEYPDALPTTAGGFRGRGASLNPGNRYDGSDPKRGVIKRLHVLGEFLDHQCATGESARDVPTRVFRDDTKSIINPVNSADLPFRWTINPYRGCEHGCIYCYARPDHERLGFSSGLDFETKIMAKPEAPARLRKELARPRWKGETIALAGVTDCYQPIEREFRITRQILEVMAECRQPVGIVTKNRMVTRDIDVLQTLVRHHAVHVSVSVTTLDNRLAATLEPRASSPVERLKTIAALREAEIPVAVMVAPIIPGLTDREIPAILEAARDAGATCAGYVLLRLPHQIKALFLDWLQRHVPERAGHIESLIRQTRDGSLYESSFGRRQRGTGAVADQIREMFKLFRTRHGLHREMPRLSSSSFRPPDDAQMTLF